MTPRTHIEDLSRHLLAGRYDLVAATYAFPLPVTVDDHRGEVTGPAQLWPMFQGLHALLRAGRFDALVPELVSVELAQGGKFRMWSDWSGKRGSAPPVLLFRTECLNAGTHAAFRTVAVRFDTRPWPQLSRVLAA